MVLTVTVNGVEHALDSPCTVEELVRRLDLARGAYAVEVNRRLVPRRDHPGHRIADHDVVE
ncbi:MAG: sulfur carrier protein ThiS, partial [Phycisphaerales bacterium]|nr:sulfur carrier protein ThiS [Phycisphaerales bacterium]